MKKIELFIGLLVIFLSVILIDRYFYIINPIKESTSNKFYNSKEWMEYNIVSCKENQIKIKVSDGYLCREESEPSIYLQIYDTYPRSNEGKEIVYSSLKGGDLEIADNYLNDLYEMPRFDPIKIDSPLTWKEDPYNDKYWRFNYYSLRPTLNLLYAGIETKNPQYNEKLIEIIESFLDKGINESSSWEDYHAVAFRTMVLVDIWWKLREQNSLSIDISNKILGALEIHGDFLMDRKHYEIGRNHGINEATALLVLAVNFPDMPNSKWWLSIAKKRIGGEIDNLIDEDGVLIENSPYYHFYTLEKYWEIYKYVNKYNISVSNNFDSKIQKMISYASFILQPDSKIPLVGASIEREIKATGQYKEMAETNPHFLYVLTRGKQGEKPIDLNKHYPTAGQTILRSGWGNKNNFEDETQIIFDVGPYRTEHSDLDALSFNLYSNGINLITDSGLYTYEDGPYRDYFKGTLAHNTVVVDGIDQKAESPIIGYFSEGDGFVYQSAQHNLYKGVFHQRAIIFVEHDIVLIIDNLISDKQHEYKQMFHFSPEMDLRVNDNLSVIGFAKEPKQSITISQLLKEDINVSFVKGPESHTIEGWCSYEYGVLVPCYSISYKKFGSNVSFITLLKIKEEKNTSVVEVDEKLDLIRIKTTEREYLINISKSPRIEKEIIISQDKIESIANQTEGKVVIIFDDGHQTIAYITEVMEKYEFKGNIAVIGKYINQYKSYLFTGELLELQDRGWNIVSHSFYHKNAIEEYYKKNNLEGLEEDILKNAKFLVENNINSVPNWYVYPHGVINPEIKKIIGKYYKFARITESAERSDTFKDPLAIKAFSVKDTTSPEEVSKEISNAKESNLTLFLTFHRIKLLPEEEVGYYIKDFEKIIEDISNQGIKVKTLSEIDRDNGITQNKLIIKEEIPEQIILDIQIKENFNMLPKIDVELGIRV